MKTQINEHTFIETFDKWGRGDNFSFSARAALFQYYEELEDEMGEEIVFDPISICCDWNEYESAGDWANDYYTTEQRNAKLEEFVESGALSIGQVYSGEIDSPFVDYLREETQVIEFDGGILVQAF